MNECFHLISCHVSSFDFANSIEFVASSFVASMWLNDLNFAFKSLDIRSVQLIWFEAIGKKEMIA